MRVSRVIQFANFEKRIGVHILQRLTGAGRPRDIDRGDFGIAQAEVETLVVRGEITSRGSGDACLSVYADTRSESVAIAACSAQRNREPMPIAAAIHEHDGMPA